MSAPRVVSLVAVLQCECGESHEFDGIEDGWQHIWPCECGRRVSFQIGDPIAQYDGSLL